MNSHKDQDGEENSKCKSSTGQPQIEQVIVDKSEICFVTSIHLPTKTFFAQLCKNTEEELNQLDETVNEYCNKMDQEQQDQLSSSKKIRPGDYVCAKYRNGYWYRSLVLDRNKANQTYSLQMIDYGNFQVTSRDEIMIVDPDKLACFRRQPFGITCSIKDTNEVEEDEAIRALNCAYNNYLLINLHGQQTQLQYMVVIPKVCYNMPFWDKFDPSTAELLRRSIYHGGRAIQEDEGDQDDETFLDEESLVGPSVGMVPGL